MPDSCTCRYHSSGWFFAAEGGQTFGVATPLIAWPETRKAIGRSLADRVM